MYLQIDEKESSVTLREHKAVVARLEVNFIWPNSSSPLLYVISLSQVMQRIDAISLFFQDEIIAHGTTTRKLIECQDKLEFAHGEIEILTKQIEREKRQYEET